MSWVKVTVGVYRMLGTPLRFGECFLPKLHTAAVRTFPIIKFYITQIMLVSSLEVDELTENILSDHVHASHYISTVANILKHHQGHTSALAGENELPTFFYFHSSDHFAANIFFLIHCVDAHREVPLPRRGDHYGIDVLVLEEFFIAIGPFENNFGLWFP